MINCKRVSFSFKLDRCSQEHIIWGEARVLISHVLLLVGTYLEIA